MADDADDVMPGWGPLAAFLTSSGATRFARPGQPLEARHKQTHSVLLLLLGAAAIMLLTPVIIIMQLFSPIPSLPPCPAYYIRSHGPLIQTNPSGFAPCVAASHTYRPSCPAAEAPSTAAPAHGHKPLPAVELHQILDV